MTNIDAPLRPIRSFVLRQGRITPSQQRALRESWAHYGVEVVEAQPLCWSEIFGRQAARVLEIGFGMGDTLVTLAAHSPEIDFIGIEVHPPGVGACMAKAQAAGLTNLKIFATDALTVLAQIPTASLDKVLLLFPDPWPKKRHHKRRIVQAAFAALIAEKLKPGGIFHLATDWQPYADHMLAVLEACPLLVNVLGKGQFAPEPRDRVTTKFEKRGLKLGHHIWDLLYAKA